MLAKLEPEIPLGDGWRYEPKWDGFRAIVFRDGDDVRIDSRDSRPLGRYFPEVVQLLARRLPARCVVDGEIVVAAKKGLDFDALQMRLHPAESRVRKLAAEIPASFVAFDLLALGDKDLTRESMGARRSELERALGGGRSKVPVAGPDSLVAGATNLLLTPQTDDAETARRWFSELERLGLDGIVAKREDGPYVPGKRVMVKVKHRRTADCVVGGYRRSKAGDGVGSLLLGLYQDGVLHYVGHTSSFRAEERRALLKFLAPYEGGDAFGFGGIEADVGRMPGGASRWGGGEGEWVALDGRLVCEVSFDHLQSGRFRHAARFLRWRDDKPPKECTYDQLAPPGEAESTARRGSERGRR
jgi:ATP-dependent DNA ligase